MKSGSNQHTQGVRMVQIDDNAQGQRIDNFLLRHLKGVPKSRIYRLLRKGEARVNRKRTKPSYRLQAGDQVRIPPVRVASEKMRRPPDSLIQRVRSRIIFENEGLMVINKPSGIAVHAGSGIDFGLIDALHYLDGDRQEMYLVHRLDRETSGCILIAKRRSEMLALHQSLRQGRVKKNYLALVKGRWGGGKREINLPLQRSPATSGHHRVRADEQGKEALSIFQPLRFFSDATLMQVEIMTGRTHQIRVHAAESGFALAGDDRYGDYEFNRRLRMLGLRRLFLHALSLDFPDPVSKQKIHVEAPLERELEDLLDRLDP
jgi:23S rRNA pseudouridine955/2504/2580 synthase